MDVEMTYKGQRVALRTSGASNESGRSFLVEWCNRWDLIDEIAATGRLRRVFHPGHGDPYAQYVEYFYV